MAVEMVSIISIRRSQYELRHAAAAGVGSFKLPCHYRRKIVIIFRVDPQHRQISMLVRSPAERAKGAGYATKIAVVLVAIAASATRETDGSLETFWRISNQRHLRKPSGRDTGTQNRVPVHFR